ncbi:hypothetical protein Thermo_00122 [Thermoplasmatales archaeon]|nr:hypothetical protein Thermo_00122 [Thermoplasmatales archaeon]
MRGIRIHKLINDEQREEVEDVDPNDLALKNAYASKSLFSRLLKETNVTNDRGIVLLSLLDGPIVAHEIIDGIRETKSIDDITSVYVLKKPTPQESVIGTQKISDIRTISGKTIKGGAALSAFYDGSKGEYFLNSVETLKDVSIKQTSLNVYFPRSRIPHITSTLESFDELFDINLGYAIDASVMEPRSGDFYDLLKGVPDIPKELKLVEGHIRKFLYDSDGIYGSPLRAVEIVRAMILGKLWENKNGISYIELFKRLDSFYNKFSKWDPYFKEIKDRNIITKELVNQMKSHQLVSLAQGQSPKIIKGNAWADDSLIVKPWLSFYKDIIIG